MSLPSTQNATASRPSLGASGVVLEDRVEVRTPAGTSAPASSHLYSPRLARKTPSLAKAQVDHAFEDTADTTARPKRAWLSTSLVYY